MGDNRLFIHIGTHKTGSTAIQNVLKREKVKLRKEGICYLGRPSSIEKINKIDSLNHTIIKNNVKKFSDRIKRENFLNRNTFVLSEEEFCGNVKKGYKNSRFIAETLKKITDALDLKKIFIIIYLRRQDDFIESLYTQQIHEGESMEFRNFLKNIDNNSFNWEKLLDNYASFFHEENLIVLRYTKENISTKDSLVQGFGRIISSKMLEKYKETSFLNNGYSRDALEIACKLNPKLNINERKRLRKILQRVSSKESFSKYNLFQLEERLEFLSNYKNSNSAVAREFFNSDFLFKKPEKQSKEIYYEGLTKESLLSHFALAIKEMESVSKKKYKTSILKEIVRYARNTLSYMPSIKNKMKLIIGRYN